MRGVTERCDRCGGSNVESISRIVGYYSIINDWNKSKKGELKARQKGAYGVEKSPVSKREIMPVYRNAGGECGQETAYPANFEERACANGACSLY
jgi:hypothetical protein